MSSKFEVIETNKVKITFDINADTFEDGINQAYKENRSKINIPGFRKGRAPRKIIELNFGKNIFYEDAINIILPKAYEETIEQLGLDVVSRPEISIDKIDAEAGVFISAEVFVKPEITVSPDVYKNAKYIPLSTEVTEDQINNELDKVKEQNARIESVDRSVEIGDIVTIDFEGFIEGVAFEGGKGTDYDLTIGSKSFIEGFEDQLIGSNVGDDLEINLVFPENYHAKEMSGKPAIFKVEIKDIKYKQLPDLNDDFAQDVSEFDTLEEYKNDIRKKLIEEKTKEAKNKKSEDLVNYIISKTEMDIPDIMVQNQIDQMVQDFSNKIRAQGLSLESYLQYMGQDMKSLRETYKFGAESQVKGRLVLEAIACTEGFEVSDEEKESEINRIAEGYGLPIERVKEIISKDMESLEMDLKVRKAVDFIEENAVAIESADTQE